MKKNVKGHLLQILCLLVGGGLIAASLMLEWGLIALLCGIFFIHIAIMTILIDCASVPRFWQPFLRSKAMGIFQLAGTIGLLIAIVVVAVLERIGIL